MDNLNLTEWLLLAKTPSIRYFTLRYLLDRPEGEYAVEAERQAMMTTGPIPAILMRQTDAGHWSDEHSYYFPKYTSTHWSMLMLSELGGDGSDHRLRRGASFMLESTQNELKNSIDEEKHGRSCFWGNLLRYTLHCGQAEKAQIQDINHYLAREAQNNFRCHYNGDLPCAWGAARALWGLARLPVCQRNPQVEATIQIGLTFLLETHRLAEADYPASGKVHPLWFRLNFPLFYQADILFVLRVASELKALDHRGAQLALEWLASQRKSGYRWPAASPYRRRTWPDLAEPEETSRWIALYSIIILRQAGMEP